ncbi:MAG: hypothetical protein ACRDBO_15570 [Lachnospiraceae bacterium]
MEILTKIYKSIDFSEDFAIIILAAKIKYIEKESNVPKQSELTDNPFTAMIGLA